MPELPEIALYKKYVDATALHKKITKVDFPDKSLLQAPEADFNKALKGKEFKETQRLGKYLFLKLENNSWLVFHFGMTGTLEYYNNQKDPKFSNMVLSFENDYKLAFTCKRKLGKIYLTDGMEEFQVERSLGKDALALKWKDFEELLQKKKGTIKGFLMDQQEIAGIGNIYADEVLFQSKIHPKTKVPRLTEKEQKNIFEEIGKVLKTVIKADGERAELPSNYLVPHRKEGEKCPNCSGKVEKIKVSGRSTYFCPTCQSGKP